MTSKGVVIVTGSAQGIGRAIALRLADDGFDVAVNDIASKKEDLELLRDEIQGKGRRSLVLTADVSVEVQVKDMIMGVVKEPGGLDVIIANAGIVTHSSLLETTSEEFDRIMLVNVRGVFLCYKYAGQQMVAQGRGGRIVGASSLAGKRGYRDFSAYSASKFAVRGLTQSAATALGKYRITVNAYAPGGIETQMFQTMMETKSKHEGPSRKHNQSGKRSLFCNLYTF